MIGKFLIEYLNSWICYSQEIKYLNSIFYSEKKLPTDHTQTTTLHSKEIIEYFTSNNNQYYKF